MSALDTFVHEMQDLIEEIRHLQKIQRLAEDHAWTLQPGPGTHPDEEQRFWDTRMQLRAALEE